MDFRIEQVRPVLNKLVFAGDQFPWREFEPGPVGIPDGSVQDQSNTSPRKAGNTLPTLSKT